MAYARYVLTLAVGLCACLGPALSAEDPVPTIERAAWEVWLRAVPEYPAAGEPVILEIRSKNVSGQEQLFHQWKELNLYQHAPLGCRMTAEQDGKVTDVEMGHVEVVGGETPTATYSNGKTVVARVQLSHMMDLKAKGTYKVCAVIWGITPEPVLWTVSCGFEVGGVPPKPLTPEELAEAERRVKELGADDWATRDAATTALLKMGTRVRQQLQQAGGSTDLEVQQRARIILASLDPKPATEPSAEKGGEGHGAQVVVIRIPGVTTQIYNEGVEAAQAGDRDKAADRFLKAIEAGRKDFDTYFNACQMLMSLGRAKDALPLLNKALEIKPDNADMLSGRGEAHYLLGNWEQACQDHLAALKNGYSPEYATLWAVASAFHVDAKHLDLAMAEVKKLAPKLRGEPWMAPCVLLYAGELDEAGLRREIETGKGSTPQKRACEGYYYLGVYKLIRGDKDGAQKCFEECLKNRVVEFMEPFFAQKELELLKDYDAHGAPQTKGK